MARFITLAAFAVAAAVSNDGYAQERIGALGLDRELNTRWGAATVVDADARAADRPADSVDAAQDARIASLERMLRSANDPSDTPRFPSITITGFFQADAAWFNQDSDSLTAVGDVPDIVEFRRARLAAKGQVAENVAYLIEFDFAFPGRPSFMDVILDLQDLPVGTMRIGQWRQPFGMDALTSVRELWFLERALPFVFVPFRQTGVGVFDTACDDSITWAVSAYRYPVDPFGNSFGDSGYGGTTRVTANPVFDDITNSVIHLGFNYSVNNPSTSRLRFRTTPEIGFTQGDFSTVATAVPFFVDTGPINTSLYNLIGTEFGAALGSLAFQSELIYALLDQAGGPALQLSGGYTQLACVLTGERHSYNRHQGVFTRVVPQRDVGKGGCGAWEVAARWSYLDLNDENVMGGRLHDVTFGLNWYLNRLTKLQFNYIHAFLDSPLAADADTDVYALRAQLDF